MYMIVLLRLWCKSPRPQFYQTRSAWSMDQGSTKKRSAVHNFVPTVTKFCVMWEGLSLPQDTKFGNCRDEIVDRRVIFIWSLIHGSSWSGLIKVGPGISVCMLWWRHAIRIMGHSCPDGICPESGPLLLTCSITTMLGTLLTIDT